MGADRGVPCGPVARTDGLISSPAGDDLMVFDEVANSVHHLNSSMAAVWQACDGTVTVAGLSDAVYARHGLKVEPDDVGQALAKLFDVNLLEPGVLFEAPRINRRKLVKRAGLGAAWVVPAIVSVSAPLAAAAQSCESPITYGNECWHTPHCCLGELICIHHAGDFSSCGFPD